MIPDELVPDELYLDGGTLIPVDDDDEEAKGALSVASATSYFPRVKLCQGGAKEVAKKKVKAGGNYALVITKDNVIDLGDEVEILVCAVRSKALETANDAIITIYEKDDPEFLRIQGQSSVKDSGCMFGPEYLIYLPREKTFATFFMSSPTARGEAGAVHSRRGKAALLTSQYIEKPKFSWWGPLCGDLTTPIELPPADEIESAKARYKALKSSQIRAIDDATGEGDRER